MRRDARRPARRGLATEGRLGLRRALGLSLCLVAAWLVGAGLLGSTLPASVGPIPAAADNPVGSPTPTTSPCLPFGQRCNTQPPTATATPIPTPTPTPTPVPPPTSAPTVVPTPYAEQIDPDQTAPSIPATTSNTTVTPHPNGGGSPLLELALLGIVVCAVIAGTSFFLFFRIR